VARVPYLSDLHLGLYKLLGDDGRTARFLFRGESGESVTVCGDFDNWDPFIHEMSETSPGIYQLDLPLPQGRHYYAFVYRGEELPDPLNPEKAANREGKIVSVLTVPKSD
jgi:1,4-alpha-glucan branching enzyme